MNHGDCNHPVVDRVHQSSGAGGIGAPAHQRIADAHGKDHDPGNAYGPGVTPYKEKGSDQDRNADSPVRKDLR